MDMVQSHMPSHHNQRIGLTCNTVFQPVLSEQPAGTRNFPDGHYLLPDTNALLNGMDLFEQRSGFNDVIILQTVLEELKNRSLPLYNRVIALTRSEDKHVYVFFNDFRLETYIVREAGESINDRNDRSVRRAVKWYAEHLQQSAKKRKSKSKSPSIVMLSDDKENLRKARSEGLEVSSLYEYVSNLEDAAHLLDMINTSRPRIESRQNQTNQLYPEHFSMSKIMTGIRAGNLHQGTFNVSTYNYLEGSVNVPAFDKPLLILGRESSNRAVSGDTVVIELLPKAQWRTSSTKIIEEEALNQNESAEVDDGESEALVTDRERRALQEEVKKVQGRSVEGRPQPTAKIVGIIKRNWRQYVGHVDSASGSTSRQERRQQTIFVIPMDKRIPKIRLRTRQADELVGKRVLVSIDSWEQDSRYPAGHFVRSLGDLESKGAETEALLLEYDVQYRPFPKAVLDCLPAEGHEWRVPASLDDPGWKGRKDLRELLICSIDPVGCQDIDDALHARQLPNGNYEIGVHIADVSHFVKPGNAMDSEASVRGTTVYLVDKRIDMLPMLLGTDLCSLKPYVERFAFSTIWEITKDAEIMNTHFTKSVIRSREAFSYEQAQIRIDDRAQRDELTQGMRVLLNLSKQLRQKRLDAGALNLASPEVRVQTESETSDPADVKTKELLDTNSLVEEFMLLANITVASKVYASFPQTALLRRHAAPPSSNFEDLSNQLKVKRDLTLRTDSSKALAASLDTCIDPNESFFNTLIRILATRCMMSAEYFAAGTHAYDDFRHYGLATPIYTHFTSPIRRYADLVVHRQLSAAIEYEELDHSLLSKGKLEGVCKNINVRHRNAQMAGRASIEYYVGQALKGRVVDEDAFVMKVFENGFVVFVPRFGVEGLIRLKDITTPEPELEFNRDDYRLKIIKTDGKAIVIDLFQKVKVRISDLLEEQTGKRKVRMELVR